MRDLQYAIRNLLRNPAFTTVAVLTLALGIGAATAIFSVVQAVLLRPLPYPRPGELMAIHESLRPTADAPDRSRSAVTPPTLRDWSQNTTLAQLTGYAEGDFILTGSGEPDRVPGANVSWNFFEAMGVTPLHGRFFLAEEDAPDRPLVAVVGHDLWRARFGSDPTIVGRTIELSSRRYEVVGIAGEGFAFPERAQVWVPLALPESEFADDQRLSFYLSVVARLRPGVTRQQAHADLTRLTAAAAAHAPAKYEGRGVTVLTLHEATVGDTRRPLLLLFSTVLLVLLIASVNVANLQLARSVAREGEIALRVALGATRWQVVRQLIVESVTLALAGGVLGVLLALWTRDGIVAMAPTGVPRLTDVRIDLAVLGFSALVSILTGLLFGVAPALVSARTAPGASLRWTGRTPGAARPRLRNTLVVVELALSLALLAGAGLLAKTLWNLLSVDPGFNPRGVMTMEVVLPRAKYPEPEQRARFFEAVLERLSSHPTIAAAGGTTVLPLAGGNMMFGFYREGMVPGRDAPHVASFRGVTADYFHAIGVPLRRGRFFTPADRVGSPPVMLINDAMAETYWKGRDPVGERIVVTRGRTIVWREIVGVVGNTRHAGLGARPEPEMYMPYAHDPFAALRIAVRASESPEALAGAMRAAVWSIDRDQPVSRLRPMTEVVGASVSDTRFHATLIGAFALLAFVLAAVGLYGVVAYSVSQRVHEFGVRMALGAERRHVLGLVVRQGARLACIGLLAGVALAVPLTQYLPVELYETPRLDPVVFGAVGLALATVALAASYVPARRAVSVDPLVALREQ
jgi:putative ABC transport system permease protein